MPKADFVCAPRLRVRWAEVDMQKIVFNGHYLTYIDTAIAEYWREIGLPYPHGYVERYASDVFLRKATVEAATEADVVVMAAAPADFRPAEYAESKIKKADDGSAPVLRLVTNPDIAAELGQRKRDGQLLVAFAAETGNAIANARPKLQRKNADLIVVNEVGVDKVFGQDTNAVTVLGADGSVTEITEAGKEDIADAVWDLVAARL